MDERLKEAVLQLVAGLTRDEYGVGRVGDNEWAEFRGAIDAYIDQRIKNYLDGRCRECGGPLPCSCWNDE